MIKLPEELIANNLSAKILLQVHDELVLECPQEEIEKTADVVTRTMEGAYKLSIPLNTDVHWGKNWGNLK